MGHGPEVLHAGRRGPDVRALARGQMSGLVELALLLFGWTGPDVRVEGPDVRAVGASFYAPCTTCPDVRAGGRISGAEGRMSGLGAGCLGPVASAADPWLRGRSPEARCPGPWLDVRCLEAVLAFFCWFSSSVDLVS